MLSKLVTSLRFLNDTGMSLWHWLPVAKKMRLANSDSGTGSTGVGTAGGVGRTDGFGGGTSGSSGSSGIDSISSSSSGIASISYSSSDVSSKSSSSSCVRS